MSSMVQTSNPNVGTRQYPQVVRPVTPVSGYYSGMALDPIKIGKAIRQKRGKMPQEDVVRATGLSQTSVGRIESGKWKNISENVLILARYFKIPLPGVSEEEHIPSEDVANGFGFSDSVSEGTPELSSRGGMGGGGISNIDVQNGRLSGDAVKRDRWFLPNGFVRNELRAAPHGLVVVETQGDSMFPTLAPGERVFVDTAHKTPSPDGIYAMRDQFGGLIVKRVHALSKRGQFSIISDNPSHPSTEIAGSELEENIIGRVVGALKRL